MLPVDSVEQFISEMETSKQISHHMLFKQIPPNKILQVGEVLTNVFFEEIGGVLT